MKWNDVELVDGKFYFVEVKRWRNGEPNDWVFAYKDNNDFITNSYVSAKITNEDSSMICVYDDGFTYRHNRIVCTDDRIRHIRFPNKNHFAIWNRTFPDNLKCLW